MLTGWVEDCWQAREGEVNVGATTAVRQHKQKSTNEKGDPLFIRSIEG